MLRVLGRETSINVRKVLWTADALGIPYEREDWGMPLRDPKVPEFLRLNPNGQVPVIVDSDFVLHESGAIMGYLCDKHGETSLLPREARARGLVMQWLLWQATELNAQWGYAVYALLRKEPGYEDQDRITDSARRWGAKMRMLEDRLAQTGRYVAGEAFTIADIALGLSVRRWMAIPAEKPELPAVRRYYDELRTQPAGARYMGDHVF